MCIQDEECLGFNTLVASVIEGQEAKLIKDGDALIHAIGIWAQLHGLAMLLVDGFMEINENIDAIYNVMFQNMIEGILSKRAKVVTSLPFFNKILEPKIKENYEI